MVFAIFILNLKPISRIGNLFVTCSKPKLVPLRKVSCHTKLKLRTQNLKMEDCTMSTNKVT